MKNAGNQDWDIKRGVFDICCHGPVHLKGRPI